MQMTIIQTEAIDIREKLYVELDHRTEQNTSERYITAIKQQHIKDHKTAV